MNKSQFLKVLKIAKHHYDREFELVGRAFMCHSIEEMYEREYISAWEQINAKKLVRKAIDNNYTLVRYLEKLGVTVTEETHINRHRIAKDWWTKYIKDLELEVAAQKVKRANK